VFRARQIIANRIIEVARKGERDPDELCARALQALGFRIRQIAVGRRLSSGPRRGGSLVRLPPGL
jgi:hypothetical protein